MGKLDKVTGRGVLILAFGAFLLSFEKLHHVALASGIHPWLSWIYPVIVEGFTTIATLAAFLKRGQRGSWYPWMVGLTAFGFSLWSNSTPDVVPAEVVRAVPVVCIPLMVHMYIIIRTATGVEVPAADPVGEAVPEYSDKVEEVPIVEASPTMGRAVNNFLAMARDAATPESRAFWERKAAESVA